VRRCFCLVEHHDHDHDDNDYYYYGGAIDADVRCHLRLQQQRSGKREPLLRRGRVLLPCVFGFTRPPPLLSRTGLGSR